MEYEKFKKDYIDFNEWKTGSLEIGEDRVDSPSHYTSGRSEVIDIIEDAVKDAPGNVEAVLQGNILKYILRLWLKDNTLEDAKKARWYLNRLIDRLDDLSDLN